MKTIPDSSQVDYQLAAYLGPDKVNEIHKTRQQLVEESILDSFSLLFNSPLPLKNEDIKIMQELVNIKEYQVLNMDEFNSKYPSASPYLLDILHSRGLVLYYNDAKSISNYIWLSPAATSAQIFNTLNIDSLKNRGKIETEKFVCDDHLKALMIHSEIVFEHKIEGGKAEYIIPSYLPYSPNDDALLTLATTDIKSGFSIRFIDYMPHGIMARLICRFGKLAGTNQFYRDLLIFSIFFPDDSIKVWIKVDFNELKLDVKSNVNDKLKEKLHEYLFYNILLAYWNLEYRTEFIDFKNFPTTDVDTMGNLKKKDISMEEDKLRNITESALDSINEEIPFINLVNFPFYLSLDGEYFLNYLEDLSQDTNDNSVHQRLFKWSIKSNTKEEFRAAFNAFTLNKKSEPKKLFISYSSKDSDFMKRFTTHLESIKREGIISYWVDRMIETGTSWDDKIRQEMESSDIIIYLLSPDFIATPYIMDVELPKGIQLIDKSIGKTKLDFIQLKPCGWKRIPSLRNNQQLLNNEASSKDMVIVNTHDNDAMWMKIIENLVARLENMKDIKT
ncbi:MAG: TIR domain-containing protein [Saprospiraceae bacterium]|nr:TIR domain-containing protein [Saprospiraceae bacterium]